MKQIYMITYPAGKIYIGKDGVGSPDMDVIISDFELAAEFARKDYTNRKQILWESENCTESELSQKEIEFIRIYQANDRKCGYNR